MENKTDVKEILWKSRTTYEKLLLIIGTVCGLGVIVFGVLSLFGAFENALTYAEILLGVLMLVQGLQNAKRSKVTAVVSFVAAAFIFAVAVFILLA
ncbi:MAG: DUF3953 domain-containing protein [Clostridia bacterium]|nr:DUF3953 domain-containing protein [Clostridia bacterium]